MVLAAIDWRGSHYPARRTLLGRAFHVTGIAPGRSKLSRDPRAYFESCLAVDRHRVSTDRALSRPEWTAQHRARLQPDRNPRGAGHYCRARYCWMRLGLLGHRGIPKSLMRELPIATLEADILIIGAGGAGLLAALHAHAKSKRLRIVIAVKGLLGQSGCTRMVQGGYNAVLNPSDSLQKHFLDTIKGGQYINNQELAWKLVEEAPQRIIELENRVGCMFDRNPDGTIHQKPFAGQSFDRTVHKGDLTGIEIMSNLRDYVLEADIKVFPETRGLDLLTNDGGICGAVLLNIRTGRLIAVNAR